MESEARELLRDLFDSRSDAVSLDTPATAKRSADGSSQAAPTDISGWPWRRQLRLVVEAVVIVVIITGLVDRHRTGTAGWLHGDLVIRYVERSLDLEAAHTPYPAVRRLVHAWEPSSEEKATWAAGVYGKALKFLDKYDHPDLQAQAAEVRARLAITFAEFGQRDAAAKVLAALISRTGENTRMQSVAARISQAYGLGVASPGRDARSGELALGWSADTLEARWAQVAGGASAAATARDRIHARGLPALKWAVATMAVQLILISGGLLALRRAGPRPRACYNLGHGCRANHRVHPSSAGAVRDRSGRAEVA